MRVNFVLLAIAFAIAALIAYTLYTVNKAPTDIPLATALGGGISLFIILSGTIAVSSKNGKGTSMNLRTLSNIFFGVMLVIQIIFCFIPFKLPPYIIVTGLVLLIYLLFAYIVGGSMR